MDVEIRDTTQTVSARNGKARVKRFADVEWVSFGPGTAVLAFAFEPTVVRIRCINESGGHLRIDQVTPTALKVSKA